MCNEVMRRSACKRISLPVVKKLKILPLHIKCLIVSTLREEKRRVDSLESQYQWSVTMGKYLQLIWEGICATGVHVLQTSHHPRPLREKHGQTAPLQKLPGSLLLVFAFAL
jgi:hypothetical protein